MKDIVILGAGDFAREVIWLIEDINAVKPTYRIVGCLDDDEKKFGIVYKGYECVGPIAHLHDLADDRDVCAVIAMQNSSVRRRIVDGLTEFDAWETLIHPSAHVADTSTVGEGSILCAGVAVSVDTVVGSHCLFNLRATIGHDCVLGDFVSVMSGACISGHVHVRDNSYLATNCTVVPGKKIGDNATVGAGSVVIRNVRSDTTVMGVPAKVLKF